MRVVAIQSVRKQWDSWQSTSTTSMPSTGERMSPSWLKWEDWRTLVTEEMMFGQSFRQAWPWEATHYIVYFSGRVKHPPSSADVEHLTLPWNYSPSPSPAPEQTYPTHGSGATPLWGDQHYWCEVPPLFCKTGQAILSLQLGVGHNCGLLQYVHLRWLLGYDRPICNTLIVWSILEKPGDLSIE